MIGSSSKIPDLTFKGQQARRVISITRKTENTPQLGQIQSLQLVDYKDQDKKTKTETNKETEAEVKN